MTWYVPSIHLEETGGGDGSKRTANVPDPPLRTGPGPSFASSLCRMWENSDPHLTTAMCGNGQRAGFRCSNSGEQTPEA